MNSISSVALFLFVFGVGMPVGMLAVIADIDGAGKAHAAAVVKAEKDGAHRINGKISVARWKAGEF